MSMNKRTIKSIAALFAVLISLLFYLFNNRFQDTVHSGSSPGTKVIRIHDGDTITIVLNKKTYKVRLIGIDAPELKQKPWGQRAKKQLEKLLNTSGWEVTLEFDVDKKDQYNRLLCYVFTRDGNMLNAQMLSDGYAALYTISPNVKYVEKLRAAQLKAREQKLGIWGNDGLKERPSDYREKHPRN